MKYTTTNPLRVVTLCSGYDSQCLELHMRKFKDAVNPRAEITSPKQTLFQA